MRWAYVIYTMQTDKISISAIDYVFTSAELARKYVDEVYDEGEKKYVGIRKVELDPTDYRVWVK